MLVLFADPQDTAYDLWSHDAWLLWTGDHDAPMALAVATDQVNLGKFEAWLAAPAEAA